MELLLSNYKPANITSNTPQKIFDENFEKSDLVKIATGYISADSLIDLRKIIEENAKPKVEILIGMHYFEGFTKNQYNAVMDLYSFLTSKNLGSVHIAKAFKFHGKLYSFLKNEHCFSSMVGSSNLNSLFSSTSRTYEADYYINEPVKAQQICNAIDKLFTSIADIPPNIEITNFIENNSLLENHDKVTKLTPNQLSGYIDSKTSISFEIPLKTEPKSNLNVYFGKGRKNQRNFIMPRPWYEVELIVSNRITTLANYPTNREFNVITDDGWFFKCKTSGDFSKNFRSNDDLKILGKWIKGKLEQSGALKIGEPVTNEVLQKFGRTSITLSATNNPDIWILNF